MSQVIIIKAMENGVIVIFTGNENSGNPPPTRLDQGEVLILTAPERFGGIHVRGHAEVYSPEHIVKSESGLVIGGGI